MLAVAAVVLAVAGARFASAPADATAEQLAASAERSCSGVRIGLLAPLSGPAATVGQAQATWARFATRRHNRANPRLAFKLIERDTAYDAAQAKVRAEQLAADPRVLAVVGPAGSQEVSAVAPALRGQLAFISGSARASELTVGPRRIRNFFRVVASEPAQGPLIAGFIVRDLNAERVWVVDDGSEYSAALATAGKRQLEAGGATVARASLDPQQADFGPVLARMPANTEVVYLPWSLAARARAFYQQLRARGKTATVVGSDRLDSADWLAGAEGQYYSSFAPDIQASHDKRTLAVLSAYVNEFGPPSSNYGPPVFVAMQVAQAALRTACQDGRASREEVQKQVRNVRLASSILDYPIRFRGGDTINAHYWIFRVSGGAGMLVR